MRTIFLSFALTLISLAVSGQADQFFPEAGTVLTYNSYNTKGKLEKDSWITETFTGVEKKGNATIIHFTLDWNDKQKSMKDFPAEMKDTFDNWEIRIENDTIYMDYIGSLMAKMSSMIQAKTNNQGSVSVSVTGSGKIIFPKTLSVGMTLPESEPLKTVTKMSAQGMTFETSLINRYYNSKVEAKEDITTPAGTFSCYKISEYHESIQDMVMRKMSIQEKYIMWLAPGVGAVKSEQYDEKGKLKSTQVLDKIEKK